MQIAKQLEQPGQGKVKRPEAQDSKDIGCMDIFRGSEHSLGFLLLHSDMTFNSGDSKILPPELRAANLFYGSEYCDLFVHLDEASRYPIGRFDDDSLHVFDLIKRGGFLFLVNPGAWAKPLSARLKLRADLIDEIKRFSMFNDKEVIVYEKV